MRAANETAAFRSILLSLLLFVAAPSRADVAAPGNGPAAAPELDAPDKVDVRPRVRDQEIQERLQSVLEATGWFLESSVRVEDGVVFLDGRTEREELKRWAGELTRNTEDVAAVVNRLEVSEPFAWDFRAAQEGLRTLWRDLLRSLPFLMLGLVILVVSAMAAWLVNRVALRALQPRLPVRLLRVAIARGAAIVVLLSGVYVVLRVAGLTQLALTLVGGTGLLGLAVGIAFRDITENFLASLFLSMRHPFESGDLVEIVGITGYVQQLNTRTTVLVNLDGNIVQIPNATVYKNTLRNFTRNPKRRETFSVGIGYEDSIDTAQEVARKVLEDHPAVLDDPEPWVLADSLGSATVQMRVYFWLDGREHSWLKVRSSVIRLVKLAFQQNGISMPDEAREVIFPRGVPIVSQDAALEQLEAREPAPQRTGDEKATAEARTVCTEAEGGLSSDAGELNRQAREAQPAEEQENLLPKTADGGR